jgi:hypothetical protein
MTPIHEWVFFSQNFFQLFLKAFELYWKLNLGPRLPCLMLNFHRSEVGHSTAHDLEIQICINNRKS